MNKGTVQVGGYTYQDGTTYVGGWNEKGQKHGFGRLYLSDSTYYAGTFQNGLCCGLGVMNFPDGASYEGEFMQGWFHGRGVFYRADGTKYEGEFRGGRLWGWGKWSHRDLRTTQPVNYEKRESKCGQWTPFKATRRLVTFRDSTHGFPRNEGFFQDCRLIRNKKCEEVVERARKVAALASLQSK